MTARSWQEDEPIRVTRTAFAVFVALMWLGVWLGAGMPEAIWYGPPVNPTSVNSGLVIVGDGGCFGFEFTGTPGAFGGCG